MKPIHWPTPVNPFGILLCSKVIIKLKKHRRLECYLRQGKTLNGTGILGYKTNSSLRATNVTWLFECDVDEQLIMERTTHLSCEGVRSY